MSSVLALTRADLRTLRGYDAAEWAPDLVRLHANENPWRAPADSSRAGLNRYPEPQPRELITRLAELYEVAPERILVTRGSDDAVDVLVRGFCAAGRDAVMTFPPTFGMYRVAARVQGAGVMEVPLERGHRFDLGAGTVLAAWRPAAKLVFLCSPNNPTGNVLDEGVIPKLCDALEGRAIVAVDEAYIEFAGPSATGLLERFSNLVILRTLSKAYALAGARCGVLLGEPELVDFLRRLLPPYPLPSLSVEAALAALEPDRLEVARHRIALLRRAREALEKALQPLPQVRRVWPSAANFLLVETDGVAGFVARCRAGRILVRDFPGEACLEDCVRITVGNEAQNRRLVTLLEAGTGG